MELYLNKLAWIIRNIKSQITNLEAELGFDDGSDDEWLDPRLVRLYTQLAKERCHWRNLKLFPEGALPRDPNSVICLF